MNTETQIGSFFTVNVIGALIAGLILGFVGGMLYGNSGDSMKNDNENSTASSSMQLNTSNGAGVSGPNSIDAGTIKAGKSATLSKITLDESYWVAVRDESVEGSISYILGAVRLSKGNHENVLISFPTRSTEVGKTYEVVLYKNSSEGFDYSPANLMMKDGSPVVATFKTE